MSKEMSLREDDNLNKYIRICQTHLDEGDIAKARKYFGYALTIMKNKMKLFSLLDFNQAGKLIE